MLFVGVTTTGVIFSFDMIFSIGDGVDDVRCLEEVKDSQNIKMSQANTLKNASLMFLCRICASALSASGVYSDLILSDERGGSLVDRPVSKAQVSAFVRLGGKPSLQSNYS